MLSGRRSVACSGQQPRQFRDVRAAPGDRVPQNVEIASGLGRFDDTESILPSRHRQINGVGARDLKEDPRVRTTLVSLPS